MANTSSGTSSPSQASRNERGPEGSKTASAGAAGSHSSTGGGMGVRSNKGGGEAQKQSEAPGVTRPDRPVRSTGASRTGSNPGFTEEETKDVNLSSGGGLNLQATDQGPELSQEDPDHELRGEDQLVDGASEVVEPGSPEDD